MPCILYSCAGLLLLIKKSPLKKAIFNDQTIENAEVVASQPASDLLDPIRLTPTPVE